ncbi:polyketide cyclase [Mycobacterium sp. SMC-8]|uniref:polyketide cyclase n=1 Tax=Mycobacterium sp. SMC-8 TaxID=2857060 RepID=UPI0021B161DE|nr:polyketide cyclase [Mycobacterium sp. SMC-8]UXA09745.1 polyketide cyclase [Mycobacterium sp. SMC-8]
MTNEITLPEVQEFIAAFWYHYDQGQFDVLAGCVADEMHYLSRSDSGNCPFEELLAAELQGGSDTLAWLSKHRDENPYPLRHHATNIFRTGSDTGPHGTVTTARFYLYVNQVTNNVPFDVSSGVVDVGIRRDGDRLVLTSMTVILDAEDSVPFVEHRAKTATATGA